jgi:transporter family protein
MHWMVFAAIAIVFWGICGIFMKLGTNFIDARSMVIWVTVGFLAMVPVLWRMGSLKGLGAATIAVGLLGGAANGLGNWAVFKCLERGAKASVAIPLTALYPMVTVVLATVLLRERPTALQWMGIVLAVTAGAMLSYEPAPESQKEEVKTA